MPPRPSSAAGESAYEERLKRAFMLFDADGSGALSVGPPEAVADRESVGHWAEKGQRSGRVTDGALA